MRTYRAKPGQAVVMSRGLGVGDVVAIVIPASSIDASARAVCLDALLEGRMLTAVAVIEAHGHEHYMAELVCTALDSHARALEEQSATMPYV